ncbi:polyphosphate kinase 2 [Reichenbachiella ulvae]|uniref:ADP/GDP-polyphosphate phosphotransferase n=1 Tax=Reichenbachiella ulvae TaxID=2980104 RepID=A0ABT3CW54_9BACT|nr:polyphosphate kinase 2 [Reichenbachiella ulvae]MCV9387769.1 polyphosphate kinase 2 [Reichenbachiella ulvae]
MELSDLSKKQYSKLLERYQIELLKLQKHIVKHGLRVVILFEGRDAAGKGGTIKRFIEHMNPREFRVIALGKPNKKEKTQWYFQRYIKHLPAAGEIMFFDRSWYNRAVVEPVMGFCSENQYRLFMKQVNAVEKMLTDDGVHLIKFWLDIAKDEQETRFDDRQSDPLKTWKLSPVDMKAQGMWDEFSKYINLMLEKTSSDHAPWLRVDANNKKVARLNMISTVLEMFEYEGKSIDVHQSNAEITTVQKSKYP